MYKALMKFSPAITIVTFVAAASGAPETRPACDISHQTRLPFGVTLASESHNGQATMTVSKKENTTIVAIPGVMDSVREVCRTPTDRVVIIGAADHLDNLAILNPGAGTLDDSFYGFSSAMSPDGSWIVRRRFYPAQAAGSEQYLLYDLHKSPRDNRAIGVPLKDMDFVGSLVYPTGETTYPPDNVNLSASETHVFRSDAFFWAADSKALVFADSVQDSLSIVLVIFIDRNPITSVHPIAAAEICNNDTETSVVSASFVLADAVIETSNPGTTTLDLTFRSADHRCRVRQLLLSSNEFQPSRSTGPARRTEKKPSRRVEQ